MKKDMDLARRIRGESFKDFRDLQPKTGNETFLSLPYIYTKSEEKQARENVRKAIITGGLNPPSAKWMAKLCQSRFIAISMLILSSFEN